MIINLFCNSINYLLQLRMHKKLVIEKGCMFENEFTILTA